MIQLNLSYEQFEIVQQALKHSVKTSDWCMASDEIAEELLINLKTKDDTFRRFVEA